MHLSIQEITVYHDIILIIMIIAMWIDDRRERLTSEIILALGKELKLSLI